MAAVGERVAVESLFISKLINLIIGKLQELL